MMFCDKCGNQLPDDSQFCNKCGVRLNPAVYSEIQPQPAQQPADSLPPYYNQQYANQQYGSRQYENRQYANQQYENRPQGSQPHGNSSQRTKKSKNTAPIWISLIIIIAAYFLGRYVVAPLIVGNDKDSDSSITGDINDSPAAEDSSSDADVSNADADETADAENSSADETSIAESSETADTSGTNSEAAVEESAEPDASEATASPEYTAVFSNAGLLDGLVPSPEVAAHTFDSYVHVDGDGNIDKMEFAHDNDVVSTMVETIYFPLTGVPAEIYGELDTQMREAYAFMESYTFCTITYTLPDSHAATPYYIIKIVYSDLNSADNVQALADLGILDTTNATYISAASSEAGLIQSGYIKK